jgi:flagellar basal body P-ring formation protein FlgA
MRSPCPRSGRGKHCASLLFWLLLPCAAYAQSTLHATLDDYLRTQTQGLPGKVSYRIGELDRRTQLAPCAAFEPFLPTGSRLWGKATVGVRCLGPANWTVYVPVQVNVLGDYLISARTMPAGHVIGSADVVVRSGDLATLPANVITDQAQAIGKTVKNGFGAGQPLRSDLLLTPWAVQQGQNVKTVSSGPGFSVSSEGKALNNAAAGQVVQVRTNGGQTVSGIARPGGVVEVTQ